MPNGDCSRSIENAGFKMEFGNPKVNEYRRSHVLDFEELGFKVSALQTYAFKGGEHSVFRLSCLNLCCYIGWGEGLSSLL